MMTPSKLDREFKERGIERPVDRARALRVTYKTYWCWMQGRHSIPPWVPVLLSAIRKKKKRKVS